MSCSSCNNGVSVNKCLSLPSDRVLYVGPDLPCSTIETNDTLTEILQKLEIIVCSSLAQNNIVRMLTIDINDLPVNPTKDDIIAYILALPEAERTIADVDSKWNVRLVSAGIELYIYEIQNQGAGLITAIAPDNLVLFVSGIQEVVDRNNNILNNQINISSDVPGFIFSTTYTAGGITTNRDYGAGIFEQGELTPNRLAFTAQNNDSILMDTTQLYVSRSNGGTPRFYTVQMPNPLATDADGVIIRFPTDKATGTYTLATTADILISSLTTIGNSGPSTLISNILNVPEYTLAGLGGQPLSADLTAIDALLGTLGFLYKTGTDTWELDTNTYLTTIDGIAAGGELTGTYPDPGLLNSAVVNKVLTGFATIGTGIVATDSIIEAFGKIQNQVNSLLGGVRYLGLWNATTNTPTLSDGSGLQGDLYIVNVAGTTSLDGINSWAVGDRVYRNATVWTKPPANTDSVISVNGYTGIVSLASADIAENSATNRWFTPAREDLLLPKALLTDHIFVGDGSNIAVGVPLAGDASILSTGDITVTAIQNKPISLATGFLRYNGTAWVFDDIVPTTGTGTINTIPKFDTTNSFINSSITDSGSLVTITNPLNVTGTINPSANTTYSLGSPSFEFNTVWTPVLRSSSNLSMVSAGTVGAVMFNSTRNFLLQNGGTFTDNGYRLDVNGSVRFFGTINAASAIARGQYINNTLVATANNDVLVGLDIAPTFNNGAFTGVQNIGVRVAGGISPSANDTYSLGSLNNNWALVRVKRLEASVGGFLDIGYGGTTNARNYLSGNWIFQNGGTFTDNGVDRLQVSGTVIATGYKIPGGLGTQYLMANGTVTTGGGGISGSGVNGQVSFWTGTNTQAGDAGFIWDNASKRMYIGTTLGTATLNIKTDQSTALSLSILNRTTDDFSNLCFYKADGVTALGSIGNASGRIRITAGGLGDTFERITVLPNGNVGIGTPSPVNKFELASTVSNDGIAFRYSPSIGYSKIGCVFDTGTDYGNQLIFSVSNAASTTVARMVIRGDGNVGVGTANPLQKFVVSNGSQNGFEVFMDTPTAGVGIQSYDRAASTYRPLLYAASVHNFTGGNVTMSANLTVAGSVTSSSDIRLKENIKPLKNSLSKVLKTQGTIFDRIDTGAKNQIGFVADDLLKVFPELVNVPDNKEEYKTVNYMGMTAVLVEAIKEQSKVIKKLEKRILKLESK